MHKKANIKKVKVQLRRCSKRASEAVEGAGQIFGRGQKAPQGREIMIPGGKRGKKRDVHAERKKRRGRWF